MQLKVRLPTISVAHFVKSGEVLTRPPFPGDIGVQKAKKRKAGDVFLLPPAADVIEMLGASGLRSATASSGPCIDNEPPKKARKGAAYLLK